MLSANIDLIAGPAFGADNLYGLGIIFRFGLGYANYEDNYLNGGKFTIPINLGFYYSYRQHMLEFVIKPVWTNSSNIKLSIAKLMLGDSYAF